jgi:methylenetetrahydrofolate reductase (NADPH)
MKAMSKLAETLKSGRSVLTAECLPPRGGDPEAVRRLAASLPANLDAVIVADSPDEACGSALACAALLAAEKQPAVLSLLTRDRNRLALESDILGASALGVRGFLCLSGHHSSLGAAQAAAGAFDTDSIQLAQGLKAMRDEATGLVGGKLAAALDCSIGAVAHPYQRPMELNLIRLRKKIAAGAQFLMTQAVFDLAGFTQWMEAVRAAALDKQAAIIASVMPLASVERAKRFQATGTYGPIGDVVIARLQKSADPAQEGVAIAAEMAVALKAMPGVRGIHVLSGGCEALAGRVIAKAALAKS